MKLKIIAFCVILFLLSSQIFSQPRQEPFIQHILHSEIYTIPSELSPGEKDSTAQLYYIYKIPYNRLVFEKSNGRYTASYRLTVEVHDTITNIINRKIKEGKISVDGFEKTDDENSYAEGVLSFQIIKNKKYKIIPVLYDVNSSREIRLMGIPINPKMKKNSSSLFLEPLVVKSIPEEEINRIDFPVANFDGCIPFSKEKYDLIIPCNDTALQKIYVSLINNKDTIFSGTIDKSVNLRNSIKESDGEVVLTGDDSSKVYKDFIIPDVNKNLAEKELNDFSEIYEQYRSNGSKYIIGEINCQSLTV